MLALLFAAWVFMVFLWHPYVGWRRYWEFQRVLGSLYAQRHEEHRLYCLAATPEDELRRVQRICELDDQILQLIKDYESSP